jgi:hypothetical protein
MTSQKAVQQTGLSGLYATAIRVRFLLQILAIIYVALFPRWAAAQLPVKYTQGTLHGFLVLRTTDGQAIADGDLTEAARGDRVTTHLVLRFKDGSLNDETTIFSQRRNFALISDHLVQKGPQFKHPMDVSVNRSLGQVTVRYMDDGGHEKTLTDHLKLPSDLANGIVPILLQNIRPNVPETTVSMVVATPKPRVVKLVITPRGEDPVSIGTSSRKAMHYVVKVDIGGAVGLVAPLVGKQPPDTNMWVFEGETPVFLRSEGPLYEGGPIWQIEQTSPVWPQTSAKNSQ